jgi:hypothetical protein
MLLELKETPAEYKAGLERAARLIAPRAAISTNVVKALPVSHVWEAWGSGRLFHLLVASVIVGAVGPNAEHFLHTTNFGSRSPLTQRSELPQNGHGLSGCCEKGDTEGETGITGMLAWSSPAQW